MSKNINQAAVTIGELVFPWTLGEKHFLLESSAWFDHHHYCTLLLLLMMMMMVLIMMWVIDCLIFQILLLLLVHFSPQSDKTPHVFFAFLGVKVIKHHLCHQCHQWFTIIISWKAAPSLKQKWSSPDQESWPSASSFLSTFSGSAPCLALSLVLGRLCQGDGHDKMMMMVLISKITLAKS